MTDLAAGAVGHERPELSETSADRAHAMAGGPELSAQIDGILTEERPIHDLYGDMAASMLTFIAEELGEEAVERAWRHVAEDVWRPVLEAFRATDDLPGLTQAFSAFLISHRYEFTVVEYDDRWSFEVGYCTSGERMVAEGKVRDLDGDPQGHHRFGSTSQARPWTLGHERFPFYDVHSALWMKLLPAEWGWDVMDVEYERRAHGELAVSRYVLYKQPRT